jgi:hypothetical protein
MPTRVSHPTAADTASPDVDDAKNIFCPPHEIEITKSAALADFSAWLDDQLGDLEDHFRGYWTRRSLLSALLR